MFHKYGGENVAVTNCMSHFSMFVPTKTTVKLSNGNTWHAQGIGIVLCRFTKCLIMYPVGPVYYCTYHPSNTISSGALKFYVVFQKVTSEPLENFEFVDPQGRSWRSPYQTKNNIEYLQIIFFKVNPQRDRNIFVPTVCALKKNYLNIFIRILVVSLSPD